MTPPTRSDGAATRAATATGQAPGREVYTFGYSPATQAFLNRRNAANSAAFLLPHLKPGMRLLDCGCGPGSITCDLAAYIAPGEVVGLDLEARQIEAARALAAERGVTNARFEVGSIYALPFPDASFDAAYANTVLVSLADPVAALRELRRALKPGGLAAVREYDLGTRITVPATPLLERYVAIYRDALAHNGGHPTGARHVRRWLLEAGFSQTRASASTQVAGDAEQTRVVAAHWAHVLEQWIGPLALAQGWLDAATLSAMVVEVRAWGERPDAYWALTMCEAIGWTAED